MGACLYHAQALRRSRDKNGHWVLAEKVRFRRFSSVVDCRCRPAVADCNMKHDEIWWSQRHCHILSDAISAHMFSGEPKYFDHCFSCHWVHMEKEFGRHCDPAICHSSMMFHAYPVCCTPGFSHGWRNLSRTLYRWILGWVPCLAWYHATRATLVAIIINLWLSWLS